jgi:hypothetical protein
MSVSALVLLITRVSNYMDQSRYSEANGRSASHHIFCLSRNPKVNYRVQANTQHDLYHVIAITETSVLTSLSSASRFHFAF